MRVRTTTNPFELFLNSFGLLRVFFFLSLVGNKLAVATAFFFLARDGGGSNVERVSSSVNLTTLAPGVKTCIERATETKEEEEERRRKKEEEGRRKKEETSLLFFLLGTVLHTQKKVPADSFALRCMYLKKRAVFDETNRKIPHFTRVVQSARCERSWGEERDVSTKN